MTELTAADLIAALTLIDEADSTSGRAERDGLTIEFDRLAPERTSSDE